MSEANSPTCRSAAELWQEFGNHLRAFIRRRVSDEQDAEDVLQDVFLKIHEQACSVKDPERVQGWVYRIARHAVVDFYRARGRVVPTDAVSVQQAAELLADDQDSGDVHEEVLSWLQPMIEELPQKYRQALRLADIEGLSQQVVADQLGLSLSGAKSRVQRGRRQLGQLLDECCQVELGDDGRVARYRRRAES
jgi:RNA polymerase sigma-70 factor (ECF subfamily)